MAVEFSITVINKKGLHARAAAKLVKCAQQFQSDIQVKRLLPPSQADLLQQENAAVAATSILGLMMLGAHSGIDLSILVSGVDEQEAATAVQQLIVNRFDEEE